MARFQTLYFGLLIIAINLHYSCGAIVPSSKQESYEVAETNLQSNFAADDTGSEPNENTGIYAFRRQRRSPHIGLLGAHHIRPVYIQPQPYGVHGYYQRPVHYPHIQQPQLTNSHSQAQAISASFGNNHLLGAGGSGISAAAASSGSSTGNQLVHHGFRRK